MRRFIKSSTRKWESNHLFVDFSLIIMPCSTRILVNNRLQGPMLFYRLILAKHDKSKYTKTMTHRTGTSLIFQGLTRATICVAQINSKRKLRRNCDKAGRTTPPPEPPGRGRRWEEQGTIHKHTYAWMDRGSTTVCILMDVDKEVNPILDRGEGNTDFPCRYIFPGRTPIRLWKSKDWSDSVWASPKLIHGSDEHSPQNIPRNECCCCEHPIK